MFLLPFFFFFFSFPYQMKYLCKIVKVLLGNYQELEGSCGPIRIWFASRTVGTDHISPWQPPYCTGHDFCPGHPEWIPGWQQVPSAGRQTFRMLWSGEHFKLLDGAVSPVLSVTFLCSVLCRCSSSFILQSHWCCPNDSGSWREKCAIPELCSLTSEWIPSQRKILGI